MNWLAHIFLSENHIDFQIGNYLADPLKGKVWEGASFQLQQGMYVHKIIDSFTDQHILFAQSKERLGSKGLLRGVVIDLTYDYLLSKNWNYFCTMSKEHFLNTFYAKAYEKLQNLPQHASTPLKRMIDFDLLNKYETLYHLNEAFERVDRRLSARLKQRDMTTSYYLLLQQQIDLIEEDFMHFFPQLCNEVKQHLQPNNIIHWRV